MIKKTIILHIIFSFALGLGLSSCSSDQNEVDVSDIVLDLKVDRFEQSLFGANSVEEVLALEGKYPMFYPVYLYNIMPQQGFHPGSTPADHAVALYNYSQIPDLDSLFKLTQTKFGTLEKERKALEQAAKHIAYYFPDEHIGRAITFVSTFEYGSIYIEDAKAFAIGLDMYMGRDFEIYPFLDPSHFPAYRVNRFEPYYIVPNAVKSFLYYKTPKPQGNTFLDEAIYEGKILYAMDRILPRTADSLKISYERGDMEWCEGNAVNVWSYLVDHDILFSTDRNAFTKKFFNDGPFTTLFGDESAPRVGAYLGWQIVKSYMARHPEMDLATLFSEPDHQKIFKESKYKP